MPNWFSQIPDFFLNERVREARRILCIPASSLQDCKLEAMQYVSGTATSFVAIMVYLQRCVKSTRRFLQAERHWFYQLVSVGIRLTSQWGFLAHAFSIRKITPAYFLHIAVDRP